MAGGKKDRTGRGVGDGRRYSFVGGACVLFGWGVGLVGGTSSNFDRARVRYPGAAAAIISPVGRLKLWLRGRLARRSGGGKPGFIYRLGLRWLVEVWGRGGSGGVAPTGGVGARGEFFCPSIIKYVGLSFNMRFIIVYYFLYLRHFLFSALCRPLYKK